MGSNARGHDARQGDSARPDGCDGYSARSYLRTTWLWDWSGAQSDIEKALSLGPRSWDVLGRYARLLAVLGRLPEAIAAQKQAAELDPLSSGAWDNLGIYRASPGGLRLGGHGPRPCPGDRADVGDCAELILACCACFEGKGQEALDAFRKIDQEGFRLAGIAMAEHSLGHAQESQQALQELIAKHAQEQAYQIAEAYAWRGEKDAAFEWLERAYQQRDGGLSFIKFAPMLTPLRW